jgi:polyphenol oxidase
MSFTEHNENGIVYMTSDKIRFRHAFTTRYGGVSGDYLASLNLGSNRGDDPANVRENWTRICAHMGVGPDDCAVTNQVHGDVVKTVTAADKHICLSDTPYEADGIVTAEKSLPIWCFVADCVPVLLCDDKNGVAGAVHCGWRSSVSDILKNAVEQMEALGAKRKNICAAIGASIGRCCFETDRDVPDAIEKYLSGDTDGLWTMREDGKYMVDLRGTNARRLAQLGIKPENIDVSDECTYCSHDKYWSHRYSKGKRGSQGAVIVVE